VGGRLGGLNGFCLGWLIAACLEALVMAPSVFRLAVARAVPRWAGASAFPLDRLLLK
jgi:hypothetical protein